MIDTRELVKELRAWASRIEPEDAALILTDAADALERFTWKPIEDAERVPGWILAWDHECLVVTWSGQLDGWFDTSGIERRPTHYTPLPDPPRQEG